MQGWIKLHRKLLCNPVVCKDSDHLAVWVYLLLNATHKDYDALFKGKRITLKPGQLLTGRKSISNQLLISESKVKRILLSFENDQQIDRQRSNQNSLITILNWNDYQEHDQQNDQPLTSERPASDQQVTTNKNVKNIKNVNNIYDHFYEQIWSMYPVKKGKAKVSLTQKKKLHAIGLEEMTRAINRYKKENEGKDKQYIQHGSTFFNSGYVDYLDANYEETKSKLKEVEIEW